MLKSKQLSEALLNTGIQPHIFALFISRFRKEESKKIQKPNTLKFHLSQVMIAQAELIEYHLNRG